MSAQQPHILLITADELRKDALSCYGNEAVRTTQLDQFAQMSVQFARAYSTSPWCLPSRCAILTGQLPHNSGAYSNFRKCELSTGIPNLFQVLKQGGYKTSVHGKCHFSPVPYGQTRRDVTLPYEEFRDYYMSLGIDHLDLQDDKQVSVWFYDDYAKELDEAGYLAAYRDDTWNRGKAKVFPFPGPEEWHPDSWVGRKAVEFIEQHDEDQPLFCWVSFSGPHYPFDPPASYFDRVDMSKDKPRAQKEGEFDDPLRIHHRSYHGDGRGIADGSGPAPGHAQKNYTEAYWHDLRQSYYANVALIDDQIGRILESARRKWGDNVLIIFTADHGEMLGNHGLWGKGDCGYEDVLNVPLLVQYPGEQDGRKTDAKVMLTDIMATCMKAASVPEVPTDGKDFQEVIDSGGYKYVFSEGEGFFTVSDGRMKYIHVVKAGREHYELFDMEQDPLEFDNVIDRAEYAPALAELRNAANNLFLRKLLA
ncbi:Arylsulfatase [Paenibacillus solanacearum]|uniref:Arylsulfatase n=1 Tax=Paenibacillus solanacearum TaxID=2048548 RepID=A0A916JSY5_9BACL|nr:sulfatase-like hydrolase/transferase [Paenibacillus solanacearum]CAG7600791.1 Arylsulfatase [Paenibacillus solanacearum]